jgi:hypothetical protein
MFDGAGKIFEQLVKEVPGNGLYEVMLARNNSYIKTPPPQGWDGVTVLKSK